jgi:hypothetical protein
VGVRNGTMEATILRQEKRARLGVNRYKHQDSGGSQSGHCRLWESNDRSVGVKVVNM